MRHRILLLSLWFTYCSAGSLQLGDAVVTGFSGVKSPGSSEHFPQKISTPGKHHLSRYIDELFIDPEGPSVIVRGLETDKDHLWDASILRPVTRMQIKAKAVGQVFGIALDDAQVPNIYVTPTSFYGLNIVKPDLPNKLRFIGMKKPFITGDTDTRPERLTLGGRTARWMEGQFGSGGTPGTIWKIDGRSGKVSKFAEITLDGVPNSGPALGNITFDAGHRQFFVSDLDTGMIHRISIKGKLFDYLDHGKQVRKAMGLKPVIHNPLFKADIKSRNFDATNSDTWGYARAGRIVYGLAVNRNRLYYAVYNGKNRPSEIWSVGLDDHGAFENSYRFELLVDRAEKNLPITDMLVTDDGEMILAQRPLSQPSYAMRSFTGPEKAQVLRYHLKVPYDGRANRWYPEAQEYGVGFEPLYRNGMGGIALGYNYDRNGTFALKLCDGSLWITGEDLRKSKEFSSILVRNGDGIQGVPRVLSDVNKPAWHSLFNLYPNSTYRTRGRLGDVEIYRLGCSCKCDEQRYGPTLEADEATSPALPAQVISPESYPSGSPGTSTPSTGPGASGATGGLPWIVGVPPLVNCWTMPFLPQCQDQEPPLQEKKQCMLVKTSPPGPFLQSDGTSWQLPLYGIQSLNGMHIDSMKITPVSGVGAISNGPVFAVGTPMPILTGVTPGTDAILNLCGFDSTKVVPGKPYECCNVKVKFKIREWQGDEDNQVLEVVR